MSKPEKFPEAGPIRRVLALSYDTLIVIALTACYVMAVVALVILLTDASVGDDVEVYGLWFQLGWLALALSFFIYFWRRGGQTIGMRAWRLRLVNLNGGPPSIQQCLARCVLAPVSIAFLGAGYWWCWLDAEGRSAHDRIIGSRVLLLPKKNKHQITKG